MESDGPPLEALTRRLAECPPEFLAEPRMGRAGQVHVAAVVADLLHDVGGPPLTPAQAASLEAAGAGERNRLMVVAICAWLLHDAWFRERPALAPAALQFLCEGVQALSALTPAPLFVTDPDRREELARVCLRDLGLRPAGETPAQAADRLTTLNSAERQRVLQAARRAEERAQAVREAMAKKAAEEAAAQYSRE